MRCPRDNGVVVSKFFDLEDCLAKIMPRTSYQAYFCTN